MTFQEKLERFFSMIIMGPPTDGIQIDWDEEEE